MSTLPTAPHSVLLQPPTSSLSDRLPSVHLPASPALGNRQPALLARGWSWVEAPQRREESYHTADHTREGGHSGEEAVAAHWCFGKPGSVGSAGTGTPVRCS